MRHSEDHALRHQPEGATLLGIEEKFINGNPKSPIRISPLRSRLTDTGPQSDTPPCELVRHPSARVSRALELPVCAPPPPRSPSFVVSCQAADTKLKLGTHQRLISQPLVTAIPQPSISASRRTQGKQLLLWMFLPVLTDVNFLARCRGG